MFTRFVVIFQFPLWFSNKNSIISFLIGGSLGFDYIILTISTLYLRSKDNNKLYNSNFNLADIVKIILKYRNQSDKKKTIYYLWIRITMWNFNGLLSCFEMCSIIKFRFYIWFESPDFDSFLLGKFTIGGNVSLSVWSHLIIFPLLLLKIKLKYSL